MAELSSCFQHFARAPAPIHPCPRSQVACALRTYFVPTLGSYRCHLTDGKAEADRSVL